MVRGLPPWTGDGWCPSLGSDRDGPRGPGLCSSPVSSQGVSFRWRVSLLTDTRTVPSRDSNLSCCSCRFCAM